MRRLASEVDRAMAHAERHRAQKFRSDPDHDKDHMDMVILADEVIRLRKMVVPDKWERTKTCCFMCGGQGETHHQSIYDCDATESQKCGQCKGTGAVDMEMCPTCGTQVPPHKESARAARFFKKLFKKEV